MKIKGDNLRYHPPDGLCRISFDYYLSITCLEFPESS